MATWFTSDMHFGHKNVIPYSERPFADLEAMHLALIGNWNSVVAPTDTVYLLGDFAFGPKDFAAQIRRQLSGRVILVRGNHDRSKTAARDIGFDEAHDSLLTEIDGQRVFMRHIPDAADPRHIDRRYKPEFLRPAAGPYDYFLCGHVHNSWTRRGNTINVGTDVWNYRPVALESLLSASESP